MKFLPVKTKIEIINSAHVLAINPRPAKRIIENFLAEAALPARQITVILVSDEYLRKLHRDFLQDDTFTDVMTFNLSEDEMVEAEIYLSGERARIHAEKFAQPLSREIGRLIVHGLLHLKGMDDATDQERKQMRSAENRYLDAYADLVSQLIPEPV